MKAKTLSYKEPRKEQEVGEGGVAHNHESNRDHHQFRSVDEEDEEDDVNVFLRTIDEIVKGAEFGRGRRILVRRFGVVVISKELHFGFPLETILV